MDERKQSEKEELTGAKKAEKTEATTVRTSMRCDYKVKRSLPLDIIAGVLSLLLAVALWIVLGI